MAYLYQPWHEILLDVEAFSGTEKTFLCNWNWTDHQKVVQGLKRKKSTLTIPFVYHEGSLGQNFYDLPLRVVASYGKVDRIGGIILFLIPFT